MNCELHSTTHAAVKVLDEALLGLDNKDFMCGSVFLDISKAFDCVNHNILLDKLSHYGIRGGVHQWFGSYLADREHFVEINGVRSDSYCPTMGVPTINDLSFSSNCFSFSIFADDTSIILKVDKSVYRELLNTELIINKVMDWFSVNMLLLNYSKSQYLYLGPHYPDHYETEFILSDLYEVCPHYLLLHDEYLDLDEQKSDKTVKRIVEKGDHILKELYEVAPSYNMQEHIETNYGILTEQKEVRYLGITFDNNLKFSSHISNISMKISRVVGILWKARSLPISIKLKVYYSLIFTQLNYGILVWGRDIAGNLTRGITDLEHVPKGLKNLHIIHNKAVRSLVCASKQDPLTSIYRTLDLLKLVDLYYLNLGIFAFETFTGKSPDYFHSFITSLPPPRSTRASNDDPFDFRTDQVYYNQPNYKKTLTAVSYAASALWNKIPVDIKQATSKVIFKKRLKEWLTKDYVSSREIITSDHYDS